MKSDQPSVVLFDFGGTQVADLERFSISPSAK